MHIVVSFSLHKEISFRDNTYLLKTSTCIHLGFDFLSHTRKVKRRVGWYYACFQLQNVQEKTVQNYENEVTKGGQPKLPVSQNNR